MFGRKKYDHKIYPDEIFLDSKNISGFDTSQFEGRLEKPIGKKTFIYMGALIGFLGLFFVSRIFFLQIFEGEKFTARSERNSFKKENIQKIMLNKLKDSWKLIVIILVLSVALPAFACETAVS